ncbi:hypothetical protein [Nocardia thailandica]|uniref:hypothetical protein n=1 Tax=Nocardia thailandica TaxID=257275 RepID=UPI0012F87A2C|nr:hypothetical protein [Nocardia thailandica]
MEPHTYTLEKRGQHDYIVTCSCGKSWTGHTRGKTEEKAANHAREQNRDLCPHPEKRSFPTREAAMQAKGRTWKIPPGGGNPARRVYQCRCMAWHLTTKTRGGRL